MTERNCLSVVIPCYNEAATLETCVRQVAALQAEDLDLQLIIVDDGSTDNSLAIARKMQQQLTGRGRELIVLDHLQNCGKGAALQTGFQRASGDWVAIQDADLEYDPRDLQRLLRPLRQGRADVVLGSRFISFEEHRVLYFWHYLGNRVLTLISNLLTDLNLTDIETGYKVFHRDVLEDMVLCEKRFGVEPELVAKVARQRLRIYEMGISYHGRTYAEGKKIGLIDGFRALYCIFRYNAPRAPLLWQFLIYAAIIGGVGAAIRWVWLALLPFSF